MLATKDIKEIMYESFDYLEDLDLLALQDEKRKIDSYYDRLTKAKKEYKAEAEEHFKSIIKHFTKDIKANACSFVNTVRNESVIEFESDEKNEWELKFKIVLKLDGYREFGNDFSVTYNTKKRSAIINIGSIGYCSPKQKGHFLFTQATIMTANIWREEELFASLMDVFIESGTHKNYEELVYASRYYDRKNYKVQGLIRQKKKEVEVEKFEKALIEYNKFNIMNQSSKERQHYIIRKVTDKMVFTNTHNFYKTTLMDDFKRGNLTFTKDGENV